MLNTKSERLFQWVNNTVLIIIGLCMVLPLVHLLAVSLSAPHFVSTKQVLLWPKGLNIEVYKTIFDITSLWRSLAVSIYITVVGTVIALFFNTTMGFALSRNVMKGKKIVIQAIIVSFIFSAPLIPTYLVVKTLMMDNTLWSLMVPNALAPFYIIILFTFFRGVSSELFDAAKIDGCSEFKMYYKIVLPLSKAVLATIALFHAVNQWNSYFQALIFIRDNELRPLQLVVRAWVVDDEASLMVNAGPEIAEINTPEMIKAGIILFSVVPIIMAYPFLQKYFVKGAMMGSLKG